MKASHGLLTIAQMRQTDFSKGYFISGVNTNGVDILTPMCISRNQDSYHSLDNFKTIPLRCFNDQNQAFVVGFRVDNNKLVQPLCLAFDDNNKSEVTGIHILKSSAHDWVNDFRRTSDREHLSISQQISEQKLDEIHRFLTTDNNGNIIRGKSHHHNHKRWHALTTCTFFGFQGFVHLLNLEKHVLINLSKTFMI